MLRNPSLPSQDLLLRQRHCHLRGTSVITASRHLSVSPCQGGVNGEEEVHHHALQLMLGEYLRQVVLMQVIGGGNFSS
jgi:hypothetical protein